MTGGRKKTEKKIRAAERIDAEKSFWAFVWAWFSALFGEAIGQKKVISDLGRKIIRLRQEVSLLSERLENFDADSKLLRSRLDEAEKALRGKDGGVQKVEAQLRDIQSLLDKTELKCEEKLAIFQKDLEPERMSKDLRREQEKSERAEYTKELLKRYGDYVQTFHNKVTEVIKVNKKIMFRLFIIRSLKVIKVNKNLKDLRWDVLAADLKREQKCPGRGKWSQPWHKEVKGALRSLGFTTTEWEIAGWFSEMRNLCFHSSGTTLEEDLNMLNSDQTLRKDLKDVLIRLVKAYKNW